jgi:hypothetical protein
MKTQMTESMKIKLLVTGLLIVLMTACAVAQTAGFDTNKLKSKRELKSLDREKVKLDLSVKINNECVQDTSYVLTIYNFDTESYMQTHVPNNFVLYLDFDNQFEISVSYKGTNVKVINVDTEAPMDNWYINADVNLNTNDNKRILAGGIKYDTLLRTFKKYK